MLLQQLARAQWCSSGQMHLHGCTDRCAHKCTVHRRQASSIWHGSGLERTACALSRALFNSAPQRNASWLLMQLCKKTVLVLCALSAVQAGTAVGRPH